MPVGVQLGQLVTQFRQMARQSAQPSVGTDTRERVIAMLNLHQRRLYEEYFWAHLRVNATINLAAGERYYDLPAGLDIDRLERVITMRDSQPIPMTRGIDFEQMAAYDSDADERSSRAMRWDVVWSVDDDATMLEVWPIPDGNTDTVRLRGMRPLRAMVNDSDVCDLDSDLIVGFASAEELAAQGAKDAKLKLDLVTKNLMAKLANSKSALPSGSMIPGGTKTYEGVTVRVR